MADISFYHLSTSPIEKALPKLLEKILASGQRTVLWTDSPEHVEMWDMTLWTFSQGSFLPHGTAEDGYREHQPIYITANLENPNHATILITADGMLIENFMGFEKCIDIFNGLDTTSLDQARERWKMYKNTDHQLSYWFQNDNGVWQKKS